MQKTFSRSTLYGEITAKIIAGLEQGIVPWVRPWNARSSQVPLTLPQNALTKRSYSGINILLLWTALEERGFASSYWLTFKQALSLGSAVRKGETGTGVYFADKFIPEKERQKAQDEGANPTAVHFLKRYTVFNAEQCEGLPHELLVAHQPLPECQTIPHAEALITATRADFRIGGDRAFYVPSQDFICIPHQSAFTEQVNYYRTAFHELGHWTGHASRLARNLTTSFGTQDYAREELVVRRVGAIEGVKTCLLDSWNNPCVPDLPVPVTAETSKEERDHSMPGQGPNGRSHRSPGGSAQDANGEQLDCLNPSPQGVILHGDASMADASHRMEVGVHTRPGPKRAMRPSALDPADAACLSSRGSKGRTGRLPASCLLNRVTTGSPKRAVMNRPTWRQSRHSSQMLRVMPRTAISMRWTANDESRRATAGGIPIGRVKSGSDCESNRSTRWVC
jgi:antirestriction protein ArdC